MNFAVVEREYIRSHILPDFDWICCDAPSRINPLPKPAHEARVALVTTAGVHCVSDPPFDLLSRIGDPSYREIPNDVHWSDLRLSHVGYNTSQVSRDINCVFPLQVLQELAHEKFLGSVAPRHFSFMGYIPLVQTLLENTAPQVAAKLKEDAVDLVVLVPA